MDGAILNADCLLVLKEMPDACIDMCLTSPPYWGLRDYEVAGQIGLEATPDEYISRLCAVFDQVHRVLKPTGTCWVNLGDTYNHATSAGDKVFGNPEFNRNRPCRALTKTPERNLIGQPKCLLQVPSRFELQMTDRGWILRNEIIWHKPNVMPSSAKDRFTVDFEKVFLFTKSPRYYFKQQREGTGTSKGFNVRVRDAAKNRIKYTDRRASAEEVRNYQEGKRIIVGRNRRCVWTIPSKPFRGRHFATYPEALCEIPIQAGCPEGGIVLDPFAGAGTTLVVARRLGRSYVGIELNPEYCRIALSRLETMEQKSTPTPVAPETGTSVVATA